MQQARLSCYLPLYGHHGGIIIWEESDLTTNKNIEGEKNWSLDTKWLNMLQICHISTMISSYVFLCTCEPIVELNVYSVIPLLLPYVVNITVARCLWAKWSACWMLNGVSYSSPCILYLVALYLCEFDDIFNQLIMWFRKTSWKTIHIGLGLVLRAWTRTAQLQPIKRLEILFAVTLDFWYSMQQTWNCIEYK